MKLGNQQLKERPEFDMERFMKCAMAQVLAM